MKKIVLIVLITLLAIPLSDLLFYLADQNKFTRIASSTVLLNGSFYQTQYRFPKLFNGKTYRMLNQNARKLIANSDLQLFENPDTLRTALLLNGNPSRTKIYDVIIDKHPLLWTIANSSWCGGECGMDMVSSYVYIFSFWVHLSSYDHTDIY